MSTKLEIALIEQITALTQERDALQAKVDEYQKWLDTNAVHLANHRISGYAFTHAGTIQAIDADIIVYHNDNRRSSRPGQTFAPVTARGTTGDKRNERRRTKARS